MFVIQTAYSYVSSSDLDANIDAYVVKIEDIIEEKGESYRQKLLVAIDQYQERYKDDERIIYILAYVEREISLESSSKVAHPNILLIIADDMGLDATAGFDEGSIKPFTPNISRFMDQGVSFENLWSAPTCTPTRSTILTGKYGYRTNVLKVDDELSLNETSIQSYLDTQTNDAYSHAVIGKWHLSKNASHPNEMGVGYYAGMLTGGAKTYTDWRLTQNEKTTKNTEYITTKFTDLAVDWVEEQEKPWFLWLAYTAPHTPFHMPPTELHSQGNLPNDPETIKANPTPYYMAAIEAMDSEIGRLLEGIGEEELKNTTIIFVGDNGTPAQVVQAPYSKQKAKGSLYQGGIHVPLIVSGYGVSRLGERETRLINTTDIFATLADIANTGTSEIHDSMSFKDSFTQDNISGREYAYAEVGSGKTAGYTIRDDRYKLLVLDSGKEEFYDLASDPYENNAIKNMSSDEKGAKETLEKYISGIRK